ncbi:hypothetical protein I3760_11G022800 [Carya illinoinensis]|nr:hypothetical protein I3760_11G022800 [Carya illinoinensis]
MDISLVPMNGDNVGFSKCKGEKEVGDQHVLFCSLLPSWSKPGLSSELVLQKVKEIHDCVGNSCECFEDQFRALLIAIEYDHSHLSRSASKRNWELKRLTCSINYDAREVSIDYGRTKERVTTL